MTAKQRPARQQRGENSVVLYVLITPELDAWLKKKAAAESMTVSGYVRRRFHMERTAETEG